MINIDIININGEIILSYNNLLLINNKLLINKLYNDFICNFKLIYQNEILSFDDNIVFTENTNIILVKLPTNYLIVYHNDLNNEIFKHNLKRLYNKNDKSIKSFLNDFKLYINDEYCFLSYPEIYIYSYINNNNLINSFADNFLIYLLYDDFDKILDCDYKIIIIKLLSPIYFGAIKKKHDDDTIKNSYLINKSCKYKYNCIGKINEYNIEYNNFTEPIYTFVIDNLILRYMNIDSLYFFDTLDQYNEFKLYFDTEITKYTNMLNQ